MTNLVNTYTATFTGNDHALHLIAEIMDDVAITSHREPGLVQSIFGDPCETFALWRSAQKLGGLTMKLEAHQ